MQKKKVAQTCAGQTTDDVTGWPLLGEILSSQEQPLATPEEIERRSKERNEDFLRDMRRLLVYEGDRP